MDKNLPSDGDDFSMPTPIPLPNDSLNRYWLELAGSNPDMVDLVRPALVTFLAFDKDRSVTSSTTLTARPSSEPRSPDTMVGTGFILGVGAAKDLGLVLTAKHVIDGLHAVQTPRQRHAPSALFVPAKRSQPTLDPERLKVLWAGADAVGLMNVTWISYNSSTDIACCVIVPQDKDPHPFRPANIPIDTRVPAVGEIVHMVSIDDMSATEVVEPRNRTGFGQVLQLRRRISIRRGTVSSVHLNGFGGYKWPCFTTTIPLTGGMSGGFVYVPRDGQTISACGVVCADLEPHKIKTDQTVCGVSVVGCTWPALALRLPEQVPAPEESPTRSLLELAQLGHVPFPIGGIEQFRLVPLDNGDFELRCG